MTKETDKSISVDKANKLLQKHLPAIRGKNRFSVNDMVENSGLCAVTSSPLVDGQIAHVVAVGREAMQLSQDKDRDVIINYIAVENGKLAMSAMNNRFLKKVNNENTKTH